MIDQPMTAVERVARAQCRLTCGDMGEPPCYDVPGVECTFECPAGCGNRARAALAALTPASEDVDILDLAHKHITAVLNDDGTEAANTLSWNTREAFVAAVRTLTAELATLRAQAGEKE